MIVECIDDNNLTNFLTKPIKAGKLYTPIQEVNGKKGAGFVLDECYELTPYGQPVSHLKSRFAIREEMELTELLNNYVTI